MRKWNESDTKHLIDIYSDTVNNDLCKIFNRTIKSINAKANILGLKKSAEQKSKNIAKRNKMITRDLTDEVLQEIALKYTTKAELQLKDCGAYSCMVKQKSIDKFCGHMIPQSFSIPQLMLFKLVTTLIDKNAVYNTRSIIKPYELDIYSEKFKLAFEYDGKGWHLDDIIDKTQLCLEKNIQLITISENSRNYESDIKEQFTNSLQLINDITNLNITTVMINEINLDSVFDTIYSPEKIKDTCNQYTNFSDFKSNEKKLYSFLNKRKQTELYTSHMIRNRKKWTEDMIRDEVSKYSTLKDFYTQSKACYLYIKRHKQFEKYLTF